MKLSTKQRREYRGTADNRVTTRGRRAYLDALRDRREAAEKAAEKSPGKPRDLGVERGDALTLLLMRAVDGINQAREAAGLPELDVRGGKYDVKGANPSGYKIEVWRRADAQWGILLRSKWTGKEMTNGVSNRVRLAGILGHLKALLASDAPTLSEAPKKRKAKKK